MLDQKKLFVYRQRLYYLIVVVLLIVLVTHVILYLKDNEQSKIMVEYESLFNTEQMNGNCKYVKSNKNTARLSNITELLCNSKVVIHAGSCVFLQKESESIKCFPLFIIIGAMKSGTGALMKWLNMHPMLVSGKGKDNSNEIHFFGSEEFNKSICKHKDYIKHFPDFRGADLKIAKFTFDKSPDYVRNLDSLIQIKETIPNIKLIFILRHPVERAISGFRHNCRHRRYITIVKNLTIQKESNSMSRTFLPIGSILNINTFFYNVAELHDVKRYMDDNDYKVLHYPCSVTDFVSYYLNNNDLALHELSIGFYDLQLKQLLTLFSSHNILVLFQEDMWKGTFNILRIIENFLNIPCYNYSRVALLSDLNLQPPRKDSMSLANYLYIFNKVIPTSTLLSLTSHEKLMLCNVYRKHVANLYILLKYHKPTGFVRIPETWIDDFNLI